MAVFATCRAGRWCARSRRARALRLLTRRTLTGQLRTHLVALHRTRRRRDPQTTQT
jgi:hypothetical protein